MQNTDVRIVDMLTGQAALLQSMLPLPLLTIASLQVDLYNEFCLTLQSLEHVRAQRNQLGVALKVRVVRIQPPVKLYPCHGCQPSNQFARVTDCCSLPAGAANVTPSHSPISVGHDILDRVPPAEPWRCEPEERSRRGL